MLAAVWDACWGSEEKIDPWHLSEQPLPLPDGRLSRDDEAAVVYRELVLKVLRNEVSGKYAAFVASWIADVEADLAKSGGPAVPVTPAVVEKRRSGRLPKDESEGRRMDMLATLRTHSSLKDDPAALARLVKVSESTVRRWLQEEEQKYLESKAAQPDDGDET